MSTPATPSASPRFAYSMREVWEGLGISRERMRQLIKTGEIGHVRVGRRILIPAEEVERFLEANRVVV